jgi:UDP:flavonoid glycosyltransferase YjiC (YdhE family)
MANGVACVTYPRFSDQVVNSALICWLGMGERVYGTVKSEEDEGGASDLKAVVERVMMGDEYRKKAEEVKMRITVENGF